MKFFEKKHKCTAYNKRFGASGGVTSNDLSWEIDRLWFYTILVHNMRYQIIETSMTKVHPFLVLVPVLKLSKEIY